MPEKWWIRQSDGVSWGNTSSIFRRDLEKGDWEKDILKDFVDTVSTIWFQREKKGFIE